LAEQRLNVFRCAVTGELCTAREELAFVELPAAELVHHRFGSAVRAEVDDLLDVRVREKELDRALQLFLSLSCRTDDTNAHG
jgi:hypothetical protein